MALSRARFVVGGALALCLTQTGCLSTLTEIGVVSTPVPTPTPAPVTDTEIYTKDYSQLLVEGTILAPSSLGDGKLVTADSPDLATPIDLYRVAQAFDKELPLKHAVITLKAYDWTVVPNIPAKVSDEKGQFTFKYVPSRVAFFMDANFTKDGKTYHMFGLVRTLEAGETTYTKIDVSSTLVSRYLLRIMQYAANPQGINNPIDFKKISPKDYNPLLHTLRDKLRAGPPSGVSIDLSQVTVPNGNWTLEADQGDSTLVALDRLAKLDPVLSFQMDQLCEAVAIANSLEPRTRDGKQPLLRPPSTI